jgi:hypothetical protein
MISLVYSTTSAQIREVVTNIEAALRANPDTYKDEIVVRFRALGHSSLDIEVMTWYEGTDFTKFRDWRQDMLLAFMAPSNAPAPRSRTDADAPHREAPASRRDRHAGDATRRRTHERRRSDVRIERITRERTEPGADDGRRRHDADLLEEAALLRRILVLDNDHGRRHGRRLDVIDDGDARRLG